MFQPAHVIVSAPGQLTFHKPEMSQYFSSPRHFQYTEGQNPPLREALRDMRSSHAMNCVTNAANQGEN